MSSPPLWSRARRAVLVVLGLGAGAGVGAACSPVDGGVCGAGTWQPGALEIHHLALGQADATLLVGPTGRSLLVDVGEVASASSAERPGTRARIGWGARSSPSSVAVAWTRC